MVLIELVYGELINLVDNSDETEQISEDENEES